MCSITVIYRWIPRGEGCSHIELREGIRIFFDECGLNSFSSLGDTNFWKAVTFCHNMVPDTWWCKSHLVELPLNHYYYCYYYLVSSLKGNMRCLSGYWVLCLYYMKWGRYEAGSCCLLSLGLAWENSQHFTRSSLEPLQNDIWVTSAGIPYWWRICTPI